MDREPDVRARAEAYGSDALGAIGPLLSFRWTLAAVALWLAAFALGFLGPTWHPLVAALAAVLISILTLSFSIARILVAGDLLRRLRTFSDLDLEGASDEDVLAIPTGLLGPQHAVSVPHLDRILRGGDLSPSQVRRLRLLKAQATTIGLSLIAAMLAFALSGATILAVLTSTRTVGEVIAWQLLALAGIIPVAVNSVVLWAFRQLGLIEIARRFVVSQQILDGGTLPDDGSPLTVLVRRDGRIVVKPRALPARLAPRHRHFVAATTGKTPALFAQAWAFVAIGPIVAVAAIVSSYAAPV